MVELCISKTDWREYIELITKKQDGFAHLGILMLVIILVSAGFVGWLIWQAKHKSSSSSSNPSNPAAATIKNFEQCRASPDSKIQESFPEVCVTKNGEKFTGTPQNNSSAGQLGAGEKKPPATTRTLKVAEWGVQMAYTSNDTFSYVVGRANGYGEYGIDFVSSNLQKEYDCNFSGAGHVFRYNPSAHPEPDQTELRGDLEEGLKEVPNHTLRKIGQYYFYMTPERELCNGARSSDKLSTDMNTAFNAANKMFQAIKSL